MRLWFQHVASISPDFVLLNTWGCNCRFILNRFSQIFRSSTEIKYAAQSRNNFSSNLNHLVLETCHIVSG